MVAALAGDGRGYRAKGDGNANATWEILFVRTERGRCRQTTATFFFNHINYGSYRGEGWQHRQRGVCAKEGYGKGGGERNGIMPREKRTVAGDFTAQKLTVVVVFSPFHTFSPGSSRIHTSHSFGTPLSEPLISSNSGKNAVWRRC